MIRRDLGNMSDPVVKNEIFKSVCDRIVDVSKKNEKLDYQIMQNFVDELINTVDIAIFLKGEDDDK